MPWVTWMEGIFQSDIHKEEADSLAAGSALDDQILKHTNLRHKIEDGSISFSDSESLGMVDQR